MSDDHGTPRSFGGAPDLSDPRRCKVLKSNGERCGKWVRRNQEVCETHGGNSPQALRAAVERGKAVYLAAQAAEFLLAEKAPHAQRIHRATGLFTGK